MEAGLYLAHKPVGPPSFSVVQAFVEKLASEGAGKKWKLCHGGALDPFAQGLMLVLVGPATKLFNHLHSIPKTYIAEIRWGAETDNGDPLGKVIATADATAITEARLAEALAPMLGWSEQVPPNTSNKRIEGERAWAKAQRGESFELPPSRVYLHSARWLSHQLPLSSRIELVCRGGYYVRSFARDLGRALGSRAHLSALHRTAIGPWSDVETTVRAPTGTVLSWASTLVLDDEEWGHVRRGGALEPRQLVQPTWALPTNFPNPDAPIRVIHQEKLKALLDRETFAPLIDMGAGL